MKIVTLNKNQTEPYYTYSGSMYVPDDMLVATAADAAKLWGTGAVTLAKELQDLDWDDINGDLDVVVLTAADQQHWESYKTAHKDSIDMRNM